MIKRKYSAWLEEVAWYVTCRNYRSLALQKSCAFSKIVKRCSINSTLQVEWIVCKGHMQELRAESMWIIHSNLHLQMGGVLTMQTLQVKRKCQLVVRLKANKCYQELLCYLFSYINLLNQQTSLVDSRLLAGFRPLAPDLELSPVSNLVWW